MAKAFLPCLLARRLEAECCASLRPSSDPASPIRTRAAALHVHSRRLAEVDPRRPPLGTSSCGGIGPLTAKALLLARWRGRRRRKAAPPYDCGRRELPRSVRNYA